LGICINNFSKILDWRPPKNWLEIKTIDLHTEGEPLRMIIKGYPALKGKTILEKRKFAKNKFDNIRRALILEPRGHSDMYGAIITEPVTKEADIGVIFIHNDGYSTGCGHAVIAITKALVETGYIKKVEPETTLRMDVPSGHIISYARVVDNEVKSVRFMNVPSFVQELNGTVNITDYQDISYDIAFGGAFYAIVSAEELGLDCKPSNINKIINVGMEIKNAISNKVDVFHPFDKELNFLYGTIFIDKASKKEYHSKNVCVFANGEVDRSPTGTGVSARIAVHYARNEIALGTPITIESIIGTTFTVRAIEKTKTGKYDAVIPEVQGSANIIGKNSFWIDPQDKNGQGFILK